GIKRRLFRCDGEVLLEALELRDGALALALPLAQVAFRAARPLLRDDAGIVRRAQLVFERVQLRRDEAGVRLDGAEVRFEIGELALDREDARRRPFGAPADHERSANDVAIESDE